jgi:hypothetical protein
MPSESKSEHGKSQGRGRSNSLPSNVVDYLKDWLMSPEHINHPYPTEEEKMQMVADTSIELKRLNNWFVNNRIRYWKPRMEALQRQKRPEPSSGATDSDVKNLSVLKPSLFDQITKSMIELQHKTKLPYFETQAPASSSSSVCLVSDVSSPANESTDDGNASDVLSDIDSIQVNETTIDQAKHRPSRSRVGNKRRFDETDDYVCSPRSKYSRKNIRLWRVACESSPRVYDDGLPSLDEAACLFGYSSDISTQVLHTHSIPICFGPCCRRHGHELLSSTQHQLIQST